MTNFWNNVRMGADCWEWLGSKNRGYGRYGQRAAHRVAYELASWPIPEGLTLDHLCKNKACVNPSHLEPVTLRENILRGPGPAHEHKNATRCKRGHEFNAVNTVAGPNGWRRCRICVREAGKLAMRRYRERQSCSM